jgi:glutamine amidotransferase
MCRWLAYSGRPVYLDEVLFKPEHSLISQSMRARKSHVTTNGDGFGVGWYGAKREPGLYRDYRPAWNDDNLRSLAEQIDSRLFFAHVRASTGTAASRANCHPFRHGRWLFMHNGQIGGFDRVARDLDFMLAPAFYRARGGTTDSETLFYLLLTLGLERDAETACAAAVAMVEAAMAANGVDEPLRLTCAFTDGERVWAVRYASDGAAPSLFWGAGDGLRRADGNGHAGGDPGSLLILSEPLDGDFAHWRAVPDSHFLVAHGGAVATRPFAPAAAAAARIVAA